MGFFDWLQRLPVSQAILTGAWAHPLLLCAHGVGMGVVVGIIYVMALRLVGFAPGLTVAIFRRLVPIAWAGFWLNFASGVLMFMAYAKVLSTNWTFQLKMALILASGLTVWAMWRAIREAPPDEQGVGFSSRARWLAILAVIFWTGAIAAGRYIAYTAPEGI